MKINFRKLNYFIIIIFGFHSIEIYSINKKEIVDKFVLDTNVNGLVLSGNEQVFNNRKYTQVLNLFAVQLSEGMRRLETSPADFLRRRFLIENARRGDPGVGGGG